MRSIPLVLCLISTVAVAQQSSGPGASSEPTPPPLAPAAQEPTPPPPPPSFAPSGSGPATPAGERAVRYSRFSAGAGGPLLGFTSAMSGIVSGAMLGHAYRGEDSPSQRRGNSAYTGAMLGGLVLGTAGTLYQYYTPVERNESFLLAGAASTGFVAGLAFGNSQGQSSRERAWLSLATTQAGVLGVLALTHGGGDVSSGDSALVGMASLYAFALTGLTQGIIHSERSGESDYTPTFIAPAVGMAIGGLLALPLELESERVLKLTLVPLGVGTTMLWLGSLLADGTTVPLTAMAGIVTSFALTLLLTSDPGVPTEREGLRRAEWQPVPVPVVMAAGRDNSALAAGPGLFMRF